MSYLDTYRNRLLGNGESSSDSIIEATKESVSRQFDESLFVKTVVIDKVNIEAIITQGKNRNEKQFLLKPVNSNDAHIGSVVVFDNDSYLAMDFMNEGVNSVYPTGKLKLCNTSLSLPGEEVCEVIGTDEWGRPVEKCTPGTPIIVPAIAESTFYRSDESQEPINLPEGKCILTIPYTTHDDLVLGGQITLYGDSYSIKGIDKTQSNGTEGLLRIHAEKVVG